MAPWTIVWPQGTFSWWKTLHFTQHFAISNCNLGHYLKMVQSILQPIILKWLPKCFWSLESSFEGLFKTFLRRRPPLAFRAVVGLNYFDDALGLYNQLSYNFSYWPKISSYFAFLNQPSGIHCEQNHIDGLWGFMRLGFMVLPLHVSSFIRFSEVVTGCLKLFDFVRGCQRLSEVVWGWMRLDEVVWGCLMLSEIVWVCQRLSEVVWG